MSKEELGKDMLGYPKQVFFILGNEFCERFSFYGMRAVLSKYLKDDLKFSEDTSTSIFHAFGFLAYFTPIFGAILADNYIGKFKTIFYVSIIYVFGHLIKTIGATPVPFSAQVAMSFVGLILIAIGTGGIKPCVASFGGDQFTLPEQQNHLEKFFYIFYLSINVGSFFGTLLTPKFRKDVYCFGKESCYPLAFGFPALLMAVALILFLLGKPFYKSVEPQGNILLKVLKVYSRGISQRFKSSKTKVSHWLDRSKDKFDHQLVEESKILLKIFALYLPLPVFWTLFDQQGSRWVFQGNKMDGWSDIIGEVKPDQMSTINPFLIVILIPLFNFAVYPVLNKLNILTKPLHRMFLGGMLAALAFVASAVLQQTIKSYNSPFYEDSHGNYYVMNASPCKTSTYFMQHDIEVIENGTSAVHSMEPGMLNINIKDAQLPCLSTLSIEDSFDIKVGEFSVFLLHGSPDQLYLTKILEDTQLKQGHAKTMVIGDQSSQIVIKQLKDANTISLNLTQKLDNGLFASEFTALAKGKYSITQDEKEFGAFEVKEINSIVHIYIESQSERIEVFEEHGFVNVHIFWQVPQYVILTVGEILFSVTGLEFSYSQAPTSMKAVVQAAWLVTNALGNVLVIIVSGVHAFNRVTELIFFSILMAICMIIFLGLGYYLGFMSKKVPEANEPVEKETETSSL
ncbi:solute carrier family 15 member 2 isoform X1 [Lepeophtheirus salmonis]|uniref:solute carrier family 15 member 2 isoform X1 n=1 Tax=Lepeophtheirus salmonis TaxID=72036 RepID=UPI001AE3A264|nr:solute carrier family 15 member 2-like isoform X1 [Lepeophtheirus salmonis]